TPERHRFRLVFALPRPIETAKEMAAASRSLTLRLSGDPAATDAARIYYGSRGSNPQVFDRCISAELLDELIAQGLEANQRDATGTGIISTVSKLALKPDQAIQLVTGEFKEFRQLYQGTTVHCPFHRDENPSAFVVRSNNGSLGIHCSTCAQT